MAKKRRKSGLFIPDPDLSLGTIQNSSLQVEYCNFTGGVSEKILSDQDTNPMDLGRFNFLSYQLIFKRFQHLKTDLDVHKKMMVRHFFEDSKSIFEPMMLKVETVLLNQDMNHQSIQPSPTIYFGHPFSRENLKKQAISSDTSEPIKLDKALNFYRENILYQDKYAPSDLCVKSGNRDEWDLNSVCIMAVSPFEEVKIIHPQNYSKIWQDGSWADIEWDGLGGIVNGNTQGVPRLK